MPTNGTDPGFGISGYGTTLAGATSGSMGMITQVGLSGMEVDVIDVTTMASPNKWKQFIAGLREAKEITLTINYHPSMMTKVLANFGKPNENWTITFPDTSTFVCLGFIKRAGAAVPHGDKITQDITVQLSGAPAWNAASGAAPF